MTDAPLVIASDEHFAELTMTNVSEVATSGHSYGIAVRRSSRGKKASLLSWGAALFHLREQAKTDPQVRDALLSVAAEFGQCPRGAAAS